jgi:hypothetical protein
MPSTTSVSSTFGWSAEGAAMTVFFISSLSQLGTDAWKIIPTWGLMYYMHQSTNLQKLLTFLGRSGTPETPYASAEKAAVEWIVAAVLRE